MPLVDASASGQPRTGRRCAWAMLCAILTACPGSNTDPPSDPGCPGLPARCPEPWTGRCDAALRGSECSRKPGAVWEICYCDEEGRFVCRDCHCGGRDAAAGECSTAGTVCRWSAETYCVCAFPEHSWVCCGSEASQCPAQRPVEGSLCGCNVGGLLGPGSCEYECVRCTCEQLHWTCQAAQPAPGCDGGP